MKNDNLFMEKEARKVLAVLFQLPGVRQVSIKDIVINSIGDEGNIQQGLELCYHDKLSDVDFYLQIELREEDFLSETPFCSRYLPLMGIQEELFGVLLQGGRNTKISDERQESLRICLKSGFRMDINCFARKAETSDALSEIQSGGEKIQKIAEFGKAEDFWFTSILTLCKLLRNDYIIADHLTHKLIMEGLVLQMNIRDSLYDTTFHRYGYKEELEYLEVDTSPFKELWEGKDMTFGKIAERLVQAVLSYDKLSGVLESQEERPYSTFFDIWHKYVG